jgi:hypothetical protein
MIHHALSTTRLVALLLVALCGVPAVASAASSDAIYADCQDGRLDKKYAVSDLRSALDNIPVDLDEYSNCRELLRSARQGVRGSGGSGPGSQFNGADGYGALPAGEGGLPLGPDSQPIDPVGVASQEERAEVERARESLEGAGDTATGGDRGSDDTVGTGIIDAATLADEGATPTRASGAELPTSLVVLLALCAGVLLALVVPRLTGLVLRRSA